MDHYILFQLSQQLNDIYPDCFRLFKTFDELNSIMTSNVESNENYRNNAYTIMRDKYNLKDVTNDYLEIIFNGHSKLI